MDISHCRLKVLDLARERADLEDRLIKHERFVKGSLVQLRIRCGKPGCRCQKLKRHRHGPLLYLTFNVEGRTRNIYVPKAWVARTQALGEAAKSFRRARQKWLKINKRMWDIFREMERLKTIPLPYEPSKKSR